MRFLSNVLATIVGLLLFTVIAFFIFIGFIGIVASSEDKVNIKDNTLLHINLENKLLVERALEDPLAIPSIGPFSSVPSVGLNELKTAIRTAKDNDNIKGIYLQTGVMLGGGPALLLELRDELEAFKESGKFIVSYGELFTEGGYFLSSVADEVYLNPMGALEFNGLSSTSIFFTNLFKKLEVEPVIFRVGEFKSAVEPFMLEKMSEENRLQTAVFLNDLNDFALQKISANRNIELARLKEINDQMLVRKNQDALDLKLVDGLWYSDQVGDLLREKLGMKEDEDIRTVNVTNINKTAETKNRSSKNRIAVIVAEGEIVSGDSEGAIGSRKFANELRKARKDKDIKAIVLRVNSPGGSVLASEVIWREMAEAKKEKPVIASMSELAASGGYYISAPADTIVAQPNTITGSIGIFGLWFNMQGLLNNKLGITTDEVGTGEYSDFMNPTRPISPAEKQIVQNQVEDGYDTFLQRVADGRNMTKEQVMEVASGRVWSGLQAKENGLVDILGGLDDAVRIAAEKAGVADDYRVLYYPEQKTFIERFLSEFSRDVQSRYMKFKLGSDQYFLYQQLERIKKYDGLMVRLPFDIEIR
ncbi:signal peptide peptidase SppA [Litoribacter ruber]|uniref:signal peptide peptidase SppA n=1 Tax=Litoribacter ruber TaxID=702568 RepID=UPI001BDA9252|nr:signal peptide peptidase SppA [Litoribacter ruber]MBT0810942.1 signal peptide peptidase SppA [Litoribacter ruber]